jgi:hypothetical protein
MVNAIPLRCRKWDCHTCGPRNRRRLLRCLASTQVDTLMTLTCSRVRYRTPRLAFIHLSRAIPHLMKRLRRTFPRSRIEYFCVWEQTRSGWPHVHVLFRGPYIPQRCLSRQWDALTGSPVVDIRHVDTRRTVAAYVSKYLVKQPHVPPGFRRFRTSRSFWQEESPTRRSHPDPDNPWRLRSDSIWDLAYIWARLGLAVSYESDEFLLARTKHPPPSYFPEVPSDVQAPLQL